MASTFSLADYLVSGQPESYISGLNSTITDRLYALYQAAPPEVRSNLHILSGARSNERQQQLWDAALKKYGSAEKARKWVAPPGKSQHNHGNAVDFRYGNDAARKWVHANADKYGLHFRMGNEPWHIEPMKNWKGSVPPIPKVNIGAANVVPANLTRSLDNKRIEFAQNAAPPRPASMSPAVAAARQRTASLAPVAAMPRSTVPSYTPNLNIPSGSNVPQVDVGYNPQLQAYLAPGVREEIIDKIMQSGQTSVRPFGLDALEMAMAPARQPLPALKPPVSVRVPTGVTQDPVGRGASLRDLARFNPQPSGIIRTAGLAGTVQMPPGARPSSVPLPPSKSANTSLNEQRSEQSAMRQGVKATSAPAPKPQPYTATSLPPVGVNAKANLHDARSEQAIIRATTPAAPQTKTITKTIMVPNPEWGKVNPVAVNKLQDIHDRREAGVMAAQGIPQNIPQFIPKTITQVAPATMSPQLAAVRKSVPLPPQLPAINAPIPRPFAEGMLARAKGMQAPPTLMEALGTWFNGTPLGQGVSLLNGKLPQAQNTGGGLLGALMGTRNTQPIHLAIAQQALRDPVGFQIGEANRRSPNPSYSFSGENNAFMPASYQNSSRQQTGY